MTQLALCFPPTVRWVKDLPAKAKKKKCWRSVHRHTGRNRAKIGAVAVVLGGYCRIAYFVLQQSTLIQPQSPVVRVSESDGRAKKNDARKNFLFFFETKTKFLFICFLLDFERGDSSFSARAVATFFRQPRFHFPRNRPPSEALLLVAMRRYLEFRDLRNFLWEAKEVENQQSSVEASLSINR